MGIPRWSPYYPACGYYPPGYVPWSYCGFVPWVVPTVADFKAQFYRDFPYAPAGNTSLDYIQDQDIQNAINMAAGDFNPKYGTNNQLIFLWLSAHYMVLSIRNSSMGLNSQAKFAQESSSVGSVSTVNSIAERFKDEPNFSKYLSTGYGQIYLDMVYPFTVGGAIGIVEGEQTNA